MGKPENSVSQAVEEKMEIDSQSSLQTVALLCCTSASIEDVLRWMAQHGQSVTANFGEDNNLWEVSWISGGVRFNGFRPDLRNALLECLNSAFARAVKETGGIGA